MKLSGAVILTWVALVAGSFFIGLGLFGMAQGWVPALGLTMVIVGAVSFVNKKAAAFTGVHKSIGTYVLVIGAVLLLGAYGTFGSGIQGQIYSVGMGATTASFIPVGSVGTPAVAASGVLQACKEQAGTENFGKAATVTVNAYDAESATPYSAAVDGKIYIVNEKDGSSTVSSDTSALSLASYSVGDVISIYGGSSTTYYVEDKVNLCIDKAAMPLELKAHAVMAKTDGAITCYDSTGSATCSGGTNSSQEDSDITLGASAEDTFWLKFKVNSNTKSMNFFGYTTATWNDIAECYPRGSEFTKTAADVVTQNIAVQPDDTTANYTGGYDSNYVLSAPILLSGWDSIKKEFYIKAGTTDPSTTTTFASQDACVVVVRDAAWEKGDDGKLYMDLKIHNQAESNVGLVEEYADPVGATTGTVIEGI